MIAVLHANYGAAYLWALKDIATDTEIVSATGINLKKFESEIVRIQDEATKRAIRVCPKYNSSVSYLSNLAK
jgi:hypothetical protein